MTLVCRIDLPLLQVGLARVAHQLMLKLITVPSGIFCSHSTYEADLLPPPLHIAQSWGEENTYAEKMMVLETWPEQFPDVKPQGKIFFFCNLPKFLILALNRCDSSLYLGSKWGHIWKNF
jgi:hypothetical protein